MPCSCRRCCGNNTRPAGRRSARRVFAGDLHADQIGQTADLLHVALELEGEDDILVGHGLTIMPDRALMPGEIQHLTVFRNLVAGEKIGLQIAVRVAIDVVAPASDRCNSCDRMRRFGWSC